MASHCTNTQAEQWAIYKAIKHVMENYHTYKGHIKFHTDSQTTLKILKNKKRYTGLSLDLISIANDLGKIRKTSFHWIPGHQGNPGNELADKLAKRASVLESEPTCTKLPNTWLKNKLSILNINQWQRDWDSADTGRMTHRFIPTIDLRYKTRHYTPDAETSQLLTGHSNFASYLCRFGKQDTNTCNCDNISEGDSTHLIYDCTNFDQERLPFIGTCLNNKLNWPPSQEDIYSNKQAWNSLKNFIHSTKVLSNNYQTVSDT
ncbi:uncharacterized protein [Centruroides vittatus]|uniref:uncharacterized protein n=1 Tax=Centruroides vittatus TaxID=120091 RepID=UPI00350F7211